MSFFDDSPELVSDLRDVFNILYPPSPTSTSQEDWEETEEDPATLVVSIDGPAEDVDLDSPVQNLAPLDVHQQDSNATAHDLVSGHQLPGYVDSLLSKLSRKRIRAILDTTLPLIGRASTAPQGKTLKRRKLIQSIEPGIQIPERRQADLAIPALQRYAHGKVTPDNSTKRDRQRSVPSKTSDSSLYNPFSALSYLARLRTFGLTTYPSKSSPLLSPQACAQAGWINRGGKDRLFCQVCQKAWRVEMPADVAGGGVRLSPVLKQKYIQLLAEQLVLAHSPSCPWRIRQCPPTIHQDLLSLNPPISSHLASAAFEVESHILAKGKTPSIAHFEEADIDLVSPLSATEIDHLTRNVNSALEDESASQPAGHSMPESADAPHHAPRLIHATGSTPISSTAAALAFFGWNVFRPGQPDPALQEEQPSTMGDVSQTSTVVPDVLRCKICDRKIGLWAFRQTSCTEKESRSTSPPKALDVVLEHREFCPIRTLAGIPGQVQDQTPWWTNAAILHGSLAGGVDDDSWNGGQGDGDSGIQMGQGDTAGNVGDRSSLEDVVTTLKKFVRS